MKFLIALIVVSLILVLPTNTLAHVVVRPAEVGVATRTNFTVSVPTEEDNPTVSVRLVIPEGLRSVRPNVKAGWTIQLLKSGEGEEAKITEIVWSGGSIPAEQRDEFIFSAQAPAEETSLNWKAYQTYSDGLVVAWDTDPKEVEEYEKNNPPAEGTDHNDSAPKPYSVTKVMNDLKATPQGVSTVVSSTSQTNNNLPLVLSVVAILLSGFTLWKQFKKA
jgi:uncharacterized protein YcnI